MTLPRARAHGHEAVTRADGDFFSRIHDLHGDGFALRTDVWSFGEHHYYEFILPTMKQAVCWLRYIREQRGNMRAVLDRLKAERPWEV